MASVASQLIEEVTAHAQSDSLEDARKICADGTYFPNNLRISGRYVSTTSESFSGLLKVQIQVNNVLRDYENLL